MRTLHRLDLDYTEIRRERATSKPLPLTRQKKNCMDINRNLICIVCGKKVSTTKSFVKIVDSKCGEIIKGEKCGGDWKVDVTDGELKLESERFKGMSEGEQKIARATFKALNSKKRVKISELLNKGVK